MFIIYHIFNTQIIIFLVISIKKIYIKFIFKNLYKNTKILKVIKNLQKYKIIRQFLIKIKKKTNSIFIFFINFNINIFSFN